MMTTESTGSTPLPAEVFLEAVAVLMGILQLPQRLDAEGLTQTESYAAGQDLMDRLGSDLAAGRPVPRIVFLVGVWLSAYNWLKDGVDQVLRLHFFPPPAFTGDDPSQQDLAALECLRELALVQTADSAASIDARSRAVSMFLALGRLLERSERWQECVKASTVANNLAPNSAWQARAWRMGAEAAAHASDLDLMAAFLAHLAADEVQQATSNPDDAALRSRAVLALEAALRHVRELEEHRASCIELLQAAVEQFGEPTLSDLLQFAIQPEPAQDEHDPIASAARRCAWFYTVPLWDLERARFGEVLGGFARFGRFATDLEDLVFVPLSPQAERKQLEASWTTATFDHPKYRQAVPHGRTLYREGDITSILFELVHEVTHLVCMIGGLGAAMTALRAAAAQLEVTLWAHVPAARHEEAKDSLVAPLQDTTVLALAQAEQALEPVRCMRLLQRVWTPWLEGVALFAELASDPSEGELSTLVGNTFANLIDVAIPADIFADPVELAKKLRDNRDETEKLFSEVLSGSRSWRLRDYLGRHWQKYGPGYFAVRAVVARWRQSLGRPLTGTEATRILLHLTRVGTVEGAVPDLSLGGDRFGPAALRGMAGWVRAIAGLSRKDLEGILTSDVRWGWSGGKLVPESEFEPTHVEDSVLRFVDLAREAWSVHRGDRSEPGRIVGVSSQEEFLIQTVAKALGNAHPRDDLARSICYQLQTQALLLPLGTVLAPFWLNRRTQHLAVLLRTTESDKDHTRPGYDFVALPLTKEEVEELIRQMLILPNDRMRVTRLVDLSSTAFGKDRFAGRNVLAYSLGDWLHVDNAGLFLSSARVPADLIEEIRTRLSPSEAHLLEVEICEGVAAADRTIKWIDQATGWHMDGIDYPVPGWARHVRELAERVKTRDDEASVEREAAKVLLRTVWGEFGDELSKDGVEALTNGEASRMTKLVEQLVKTAQIPQRDAWLETLTSDDDMRKVFVLASDDDIHEVFEANRLWDVRPAAKGKE